MSMDEVWGPRYVRSQRSRAAIVAEMEKLQEELDRIDNGPDLSELPVGTMIRYEKTFQFRTYTYVTHSIRKDTTGKVLWYGTDGQTRTTQSLQTHIGNARVEILEAVREL